MRNRETQNELVGDDAELRPRDCEECACQQFKWNGAPSTLRTDPPTTCTCGHRASRHIFISRARRAAAEESTR